MSRTAACSDCTLPGGVRVTKQGLLYSHDRPERCPGSAGLPTAAGACSECGHPGTPITRQGVLQDHDWGVKCPGSGGPLAEGDTPEPSARDSIENLWDRSTPVRPLLDRYRDEVRAADAAKVRATKLRTILSYDDKRLNRALERAAVKIEKGES